MPSARPRCYVASPFGFTEAGRSYYATELLPALAEVVDPVDPWALTTAGEFAAAAREGRAWELAIEAGRRNAEAIRGCRLLAAVLDGSDVDSGTAAEVGYACALGIPCLGLRADLRPAGESGTLVNLQVEAFVVLSGGAIATSLAGLVELLRERAAALA